jgi:hypothetical protein
MQAAALRGDLKWKAHHKKKAADPDGDGGFRIFDF